MTQTRILIVEDDTSLRDALNDTLELAGFACETAENGNDALIKINAQKPDLIVSDIQMPEMDGLALLRNLKKRIPDVPVLMMTAHGSVNSAVEAIRNGAVDYLTKPFEADILLNKVNAYIKKSDVAGIQPVAVDPQSQALLAMSLKVSKTDATILITGQSGTGKEVLAHYIHDNSARFDKPFVAINCAAIPDNMLEAILFGYEKGAFTGAYKTTAGKFEQAQGGTLLLDEISEMNLSLQAKILRVLQEKEVERIGSHKTISLDVRIIATSNRNLREEVKAGRFREDLFYRLNVFPLNWLPLTKRTLDIIPLAEYLIERHAVRSGKVIPKLTAAAKKLLQNYSWPGNTRELENVIQRALILQQDDVIEISDIQIEEVEDQEINVTGDTVITANFASHSTITAKDNLQDDLKNREQELILQALKSGDCKKDIAERLGISPRTLRYKIAQMRERGITVPKYFGIENA